MLNRYKQLSEIGFDMHKKKGSSSYPHSLQYHNTFAALTTTLTHAAV